MERCLENRGGLPTLPLDPFTEPVVCFPNHLDCNSPHLGPFVTTPRSVQTRRPQARGWHGQEGPGIPLRLCQMASLDRGDNRTCVEGRRPTQGESPPTWTNLSRGFLLYGGVFVANTVHRVQIITMDPARDAVQQASHSLHERRVPRALPGLRRDGVPGSVFAGGLLPAQASRCHGKAAGGLLGHGKCRTLALDDTCITCSPHSPRAGEDAPRPLGGDPRPRAS